MPEYSAAVLSWLAQGRACLGNQATEAQLREYVQQKAAAKAVERAAEDERRESQRQRRAAIERGERDGMTSEQLFSGGVVPLPPQQVAPGGPDYEDSETGELFYSRDAVAARLGVDAQRVSGLLSRDGDGRLKGQRRGTRSFVLASELARWEASASAEGRDSLDSSSDTSDERAA